MYGCLRLSKVKLAILAFMFILAVAAAVIFNRSGEKSVNASLNKNRIGFISALGVEVDGQDFAVKSVIIPQSFSDVYIEYNKLQKAAGYNLEAYAGKTVTQYTYKVKGEDNKRVNLLVYKSQIIGGDICSVELDGQMLPLTLQKNNK